MKNGSICQGMKMRLYSSNYYLERCTGIVSIDQIETTIINHVSTFCGFLHTLRNLLLHYIGYYKKFFCEKINYAFNVLS